MLGGDTGSSTVWTTEYGGAGDVTTGHVVGLARGVDDLVDGLAIVSLRLLVRDEARANGPALQS